MSYAGDRPLLDNHLAFLARHRGQVRQLAGAVEVVGEKDFLSCWIPTSDTAELPEAAHTVRLVPWSGPDWPERLRERGYEPSGALSYMVSPLRAEPASGPVAEVTTAADARAFAEAQAAGFLEEEEPDDAWWRDAFTRMALKNYADPDQSFYLIRAGELPAAVTLVVRTQTVFGIYAVATRPEFRNRGYGTALLRRAANDALDRGGQRLTLQVIEGSYAERLYHKLGFTTAFRSPQFQLIRSGS
ncbi:GNAT family N-acetyltransferase [Fodinicola acaciae]|uniref:GNAT family N-acetyltransferase n=1 Tax=Fodinicola acaciae TaxID=2681555 RepID=UPI0013D7E976|nr:GNAT family N-acetyltransferase [Fodinicola acaciae]